MNPADPPGAGRGLQLLLLHCACLSGPEEGRRPARERLEDELGGRLATQLVQALTGGGNRRRLGIPA